jgi:signal transduction histidine kinase
MLDPVRLSSGPGRGASRGGPSARVVYRSRAGLELGGVDRGLGAVVHLELREQSCGAVLHRLLRDVQLLGDLPVRLPFSDEVQNAALLRGKRTEPNIGHRRIGDALNHTGHHSGIEQRGAPSNLLDVLNEIPGLDCLQDVAGGPGHDGGIKGLVVGEARQYQADQVRHDRAHLAAHLDATAVVQPDVENGHVGLGQWDPDQRLSRRGSFADYLNALIGLEQAADSLTYQLMVIEQEDADAHRPIMTARGLERGRGSRTDFVLLPGSTVARVPYQRIDDPAKLRRLMDAVLMIAADVELPVLLRHLVEVACSLVDARYGALGVLNETRTGVEQFLTVGLSQEEEDRIGLRPTGRGVLGLLITDPEPLRLADLGAHPDSYGFPQHHPPMKSFLGVPVRSRGQVYGNLYLTNKEGAASFSDEDVAMAEALALAAGIAIENTRLNDRVRILSVLDDRDRIARDLHDRVIQRIFAIGMTLQGATRLVDLAPVLERVNKAVDDLDATITEIRTAIFELDDGGSPRGLRHGVLELAGELASMLGSRPEVIFFGPIDAGVPQGVADHLLAVLREALTNAGKHAGATHFSVVVSVTDDITLEVIDDGSGIDLPLAASNGMGLANLRSRAEKLGGTFEVQAVEGGGTRVLWRVPL